MLLVTDLQLQILHVHESSGSVNFDL